MTRDTRHVGFATCAALPDLDPDDRPLADALRAARCVVTPAVWSDGNVDWDAFDLIVLRSCWDYDRYPDDFRAWLDAREAGRSPVANPVPVLRWNLDKATYLRDLSGRGVAVVPTVTVAADESRSLAQVLEDANWDEAVIKPSVSMSANATWRVSRSAAREAAREADFRRALSAAPLLVQRYQPEIETDGEWSLVYFGSQLSHAVRKTPAMGDFRVQSQFGGGKTLVEASAELRQCAEETLAAAAAATSATFTYARVDGVRTAEGFLLMELEVLDPSLYLEQAPGSVERARDAILARLT
ncbi:MAG: hypothetical protein DHS20C21_13560 [Gemmatimonadota bacterium]|nr:MAG: hypothetical protein DHS20C21_13560 [Gemmatimonadota bacterium]